MKPQWQVHPNPEVTAVTVRAWRKAFEVDGLTGWGRVAKGRGRKPVVSDGKVAEIVELTTKTRVFHASRRWAAMSEGTSRARAQATTTSQASQAGGAWGGTVANQSV